MRCYNGCPDDDLQRVIDSNARIRKAIIDAGYHVTYFPNGEFYMGFEGNKPATKECNSLEQVADELDISF